MNNPNIHVYCGEGKGKTSAAIGLAVRCAGGGFCVNIVQFLKDGSSGEIAFINNLNNKNIRAYSFEKTHGFYPFLDNGEKNQVKDEHGQAIEFVKSKIGESDLIVLDEILGSVENGIVSEQTLLEIIELCKQNDTELVLTGLNVSDIIKSKCDYISELKCISHPYTKGQQQRKGIEY